MKGVIWLAIPVMLAGCDLVQDRYRMEVDMPLPLKRGKVVNGREQLLIGGELFELEDARLYRGNGMVLGQAPDHIQRGLKGLDVCRTLRPDRGALPKLKGKGFGD